MLKDIRIEVIKNDHKFHFIRSMHKSTCYAEYNLGEFVLCINLSADSFLHRQDLYYKNIVISSHGIKSSNWCLKVFNKNVERRSPAKMLYCLTSAFELRDYSEKDNYKHFKIDKISGGLNNKSFNSLAERLKLIDGQIINACIAKNQDIYDLITDKDTFKEQLEEQLLWDETLENISASIDCDFFENEECNEGNNDTTGNKDIAFKKAVDAELENFVKTSSKYFQSFYESEYCKELFSKELTVQAIVERYPEVEQVTDRNTLQLIINIYLNERTYDAYKDICFDKKRYLEAEFAYFFNRYLSELFRLKVREKFTRDKLNSIYKKEIEMAGSQEDLLNELEKYVKNCKEIDEQSLQLGLIDFLNSYLAYDGYYKKFSLAFGSNSLKLNLTEEIEARFAAFARGEIELKKEEKDIYYLGYEVVMPSYRSFMYIKNSKMPKPTILMIPSYLEYIKHFFDRLIGDGIIVDNNGELDVKEIDRLKDLEQEIYDPAEYYKKTQMRIILDVIKKDPFITNNALTRETSYSIDIIKKRLNEMCERKYIEKTITNGNRRCFNVNKEL